jgi:hypothetical protein
MSSQLILKAKVAYFTHLHCLRNETIDVYLISLDQADDSTQGRRLFSAENGTVYCDFPLFPELSNYIPDANLVGNDNGDPITEHDLSTYLANTRRHVLPLFKEEQEASEEIVVQVLSGTENYETMTANVQSQVTFYGTETFTADCQVQLTPLGWEISGTLSRPVEADEESEKDDIYHVFSGYPKVRERVHVFSHTQQVESQWVETLTFKSKLAPSTSKFEVGCFMPGIHRPLTEFLTFAKKFYRPADTVNTEVPESCQKVDTVIRQLVEPVSIKADTKVCRWAFHVDNDAYAVFDDVTDKDNSINILHFMRFEDHDGCPTYTKAYQENDDWVRCTIQPQEGLVMTRVWIERDNFTKDTLQHAINRLKDYCDCQIAHYKTLYGLDIRNHRESVIFAN